MPRKPTREELTQSLLDWERRSLALYDMIRELLPRAGWYFAAGPRNGRASLVFVDSEGSSQTFALEHLGSEERQRLTRSLYEQEERDGNLHLDSLLEAFGAWSSWRQRNDVPSVANGS